MVGLARTSFVPARKSRPAPPSRSPDFRKMLGEVAWAGLPAAVQERFDAAAHAGRKLYEGLMEVRASRFGWLMAQACRLIGSPLVPWGGEAVPVSVAVWQDETGALVWDRTFWFSDRPEVQVSSRKQVEADGTLSEVVRGGLGMELVVSVEDGALVFRSRGYFLKLGGLRLPVPALLTPGAAWIEHRDEGAGWFRFSLRFTHVLAGETFWQTGRFRE